MRDDLLHAQFYNPEHECLYSGDAERELGSVAPWLFTHPKPSDFADWILARSGGQNWGIMMESSAAFKDLYLHLKKFLRVKLEDGRKVYLRYYDPRVLPAFLESSEKEQLIEFFGPVKRFMMESKKEGYIQYHLEKDELVKTPFDILTYSMAQP